MAYKRDRFGRRGFLGGLAAGSALLPFVPMLPSEAADGEIPKRFIVFNTTTGMTGRYPSNWTPGVGPDGLLPSPILAPLFSADPNEDLSRDIMVLHGIDMNSAYDSPNPGGHPRGMGNMLTAIPLQEGDLFQGGGPDTAGWADGISIDQYIANAIQGPAPFRSLELGVRTSAGSFPGLHNRMSYVGPASPLPVEDDPVATWERLFADLDLDPAELAAVRAKKQSVIDFVRADIQGLQSDVSSFDAGKIEAHLAGLQSIENRLYTDVGANCVTPPPIDPFDFKANNVYPDVGIMQMDLLVAAMACDMTRVGSIMWCRGANNTVFNWVPGMTNDTMHTLSHAPSGDDAQQDLLQGIASWYAEQFAYLCRKLKSIPEGDGTMLDNTLVMWCSELSTPNNHSHSNMPYLLAGNVGGLFDMGRVIDFGSEPHNKLYVTLANAFGIDTDTFGSTAYGTGGLSGLI